VTEESQLRINFAKNLEVQTLHFVQGDKKHQGDRKYQGDKKTFRVTENIRVTKNLHDYKNRS